MSSETKDDDAADSDVSHFTLDGVVAEMVIEVEDNEQNSSKSQKVEKVDDSKKLKSTPGSNCEKSPSEENAQECDSSNSDVDKSGTSGSKSDAAKPSVIEKTYSVVNADGVEEKVTLIEDSDAVDKSKDVLEEDENLEDGKSVEGSDEDLELIYEKPVKRGRGRPKKIVSTSVGLAKGKKQSKSDAKGESKNKEQSTNFKTRSSIASTSDSTKTRNLKRSKAEISSEEEDEVPEKRSKRSSEDTTKKVKKSVSFTPDVSKVETSKRLSLQGKGTPNTTTPTRGRPRKAVSSNVNPTTSNARPTRSTAPANKATPVPSKSTPSSSKAAPASTKSIPTSSKGSPASTKITPTSSKETPQKVKPAPSKGAPTSRKEKFAETSKAWDLVPDGSLYSFPEILKQVKQAPYRALKSLHHTIFGELISRNLEPKTLKQEILEFRGFIFKKNSDAYEKRVTILKRMSDSSIYEIVKILNIKKRNIVSIMAFLMKPASYKPAEVIYYAEDPYQASLQPVVKLQKIPIEDSESKAEKGISKSDKKGKIAKVSPARTSSSDSLSNDSTPGNNSILGKRKRFPSTKLRFYEMEYESPSSRKKTSVTVKSPDPPYKPKPKSAINTKIVSEIARKVKIKAKYSRKTSLKEAAVKKAKKRARANKPTMVGKGEKLISSDLKIRRKALELALEIQETVGKSAEGSIEENDKFALPDFEYETEIKEEVHSGEEDGAEIRDKSDTTSQDIEEIRSENASSEVTLSSDEAKEAMETPNKKRCYKTTAIPLRSYPSIKKNIMTSDYSPLQRIHIFLFGAADKASNLRGNLLSFGGFPFKQGSEEWKQKRFLLSLLSKNTLKEYLDILAISYTDDELQPSLITKFMNFLAAPMENVPEDNNESVDDPGMETESAPESSDEYVPPPVVARKKAPVSGTKKNTTKKSVKESMQPPRRRKVLMDEAQVRRLEADLAREQRILERERKLHDEEVKKLGLSSYKTSIPQSLSIKQTPIAMKQPLAENQTDSELLNALLDTVYKRRELKAKGAKISIPNKGGHTRLGELANVKFLVVTANYNDLDVLHHLIYMSEATKSRVRKNILDFAGFNFAEDSPAYQNRMDFLTSLGYDISRRIAFLLGLCPYKTLIAQRDLNELIMYFLMSPCQSKQVPIRHLPNTFFSNDMPAELSALVERHSEDTSLTSINTSSASSPNPQNYLQIKNSQNEQSLLTSSAAPRAKKSFRSSITPSERLGLSPSISTLPLKTPQRLLPKPSVLTQKQIMTSVTSATTTDIAAQALARGIATATASSSPNPQEFYIQQQTPDGRQKTFKLIKLPASHPLNTVMRNQAPGPKRLQPIAPAPAPGVTLVTNKPVMSSVGQLADDQSATIGSTGVMTVGVQKPVESKSEDSATGEESLAEMDLAVNVECNLSDEDADDPRPLEDDTPPTDEELFNSIREIIHSCPSLEDITLRNVINRVTTKYSAYDLTSRHNFMKECVKKVIMGS